jgi:hypothetical protein
VALVDPWVDADTEADLASLVAHRDELPGERTRAWLALRGRRGG